MGPERALREALAALALQPELATGSLPAGERLTHPVASARTRGVLGGSSWRVGRVSGIDIAIDQSWLLILVLLTISVAAQLGQTHGGSATAARWATALGAACLGFVSIVLHELGHSLVAQRLGIRVRSITLFLFGGVAQLEGQPRKPAHEIAVALAGPVVSFALGAGFSLLARLDPSESLASAGLAWLGRVNIALAIFNLAPGFPLDGGRVLRGVLWAATGSFARATRVAAAAGAGIAVLLMLTGVALAFATRDLVGGLWLVFLGWFLLAASRGEAGAVELERVLGGLLVAELVEPVAHAVVSGRETVADAAATRVLRGGLRTLFVTDPGSERLRGIVTLRELAAVPPERREHTPLEAVMQPVERLERVAPGDTALDGMRRIAAANVNQLPVLDAGGRLLGALTRERLFGAIQAQLWLGRAGAARAE